VVRPVADRLRGTRRREWVAGLLAGESSFEQMAPQIDWDRTVAFSYPVPEGIYLNRYNRSLTAEQGATAVADIRRRLEAFPEAHIEVLEPRQIYAGSNLRNAPALLLRIDGLATEPRMDFSYPKPMLRDRPKYFYGSGVHRMNGIFLLSPDTGRASAAPPTISLLDVAPTIMEAMGLPVPPGFHGRSIAGALGLAG
jgi:predicted AlkP superfamily phosphohydrolase/phosphomutase